MWGTRSKGTASLPPRTWVKWHVFELGKITGELAPKGGGRLFEIQTGVEVAPAPDQDATVRGAPHVVEQPLLGIGHRPAREDLGRPIGDGFRDDDVGPDGDDAPGSSAEGRSVV